MTRCTMRHLLTGLIYAGVFIVLIPYLLGHTMIEMGFLLGGVGLALAAGFLRCYLTEGDCMERLAGHAPVHSSIMDTGRSSRG